MDVFESSDQINHRNVVVGFEKPESESKPAK
jgi:hypothetical protein